MRLLHDFQQEYVVDYKWWQNANGSPGGRVSLKADVPKDLFIDRSAVIQAGVVIEAGVRKIPARCVIGKNAMIKAGVVMLDHCAVGMNAFIGEGVEIGEYSSVGPDAEIGDRTRIGQCVQIHSHVDIEDDARIGNYCVIRHDAFVGARSILNAQVTLGENVCIADDMEIMENTFIPKNVHLDRGQTMLSCQGAPDLRFPLTAVVGGERVVWYIRDHTGLNTTHLKAILQAEHVFDRNADTYSVFIELVSQWMKRKV